MKLLILTPTLPYPPHQGATLRNFHIIKGLAEKHTITLLSFAEDGAEFGPLVDLCDEIVTVPEPTRSTSLRLWQMISTQKPDMAHRLDDLSFSAALDSLLTHESFEVVQIEGIELAFTIELIRSVSPTTKIIFDNHNAETALQKTVVQTDQKQLNRLIPMLYSRVQVKRLAEFERWACESADYVTCVSDLDKAALLDLAPTLQDRMSAIPNCIDVQHYAEKVAVDAGATFDVVFTGKMDYRPNVDAVLWFASEIWPLVLAHRSNATFAIVGQKPHNRLDGLRTNPSITVTGWVESVLAYLQQTSVFVMPLRMGSGTRLKLIEAMASGVPIVTTTVGAAGYPVKHSETVAIADSADSFAAEIVSLLDDQNRANKMAENGLLLAQSYDWRVIIPQFESIISGLIAD